jgi:hypothetical protein
MEFPFGTQIDLRSGDARLDDPAHAQSWGPERVIRAEVIAALLVGRRPIDDEQRQRQEGAGTSPAVFVSGARIVGRLDLHGIDFAPPLLLQQCALDQPLILADSMAHSVRLYGCHLPGVEGAWLNCAGDLHLRDCRITGVVDLAGAHIDGQLVLSGSTLSHPGEVAVRADGLVVAGDLFCRDQALVEGEFTLLAARVGGEVRFTGSTLRNPDGVTLRADRITVEKNMYCREDFRAEGEVRLFGAQVRGQLNFNHATLHNPGGVALCADQLVVGSHLYCQDHFHAEGEISLVAARVGGEVRFSASTLSNPGGTALGADRLYVADDMYCRQGLTVDGAVRLHGAHVKGQLNFNHATLRNPGGVALCADQLVVGSHLYCHDEFAVTGGISLVAARVGGEVRFSGSTLSHPNGTALRADRLVVTDDMYCREKLVIDGGVSLVGAHVKGDLSFSTATVRNPGGTALQANQLTVGSDFCCDEGFTAEGMVDLTDMHVNGELSLSNATLTNPGRIALLAPRMIIDQDMFCRDQFTVTGTVCLIGAHIGGKLSLTSARLTGAGLTEEQLEQSGITAMLTSGITPDLQADGPPAARRGRAQNWRDFWSGDPARKKSEPVAPEPIVNGDSGLALVADGLRVDTDMTCDAGFTAHGEVRVKGARIRQNLDFSDSEVTNGNGIALNAEDVQAERMLMPARCAAGRISLRNGKMSELDDKRGVRPDQIDISGLSYETLIPPLDPETRLVWLAKNDYEPQPYDQLARSYQRLGYDESARKVQLAQERRRRNDLSPARKAWGYLQDWTIGYGYRPYRAATLFILVVLVGVVWFSIYPPLPMDPDPAPQFNPFFYTLDILVPFADFGQRELWNSTTGNEITKIVLAVFGWTLASTAIAGLSRALTRS